MLPAVVANAFITAVLTETHLLLDIELSDVNKRRLAFSSAVAVALGYTLWSESAHGIKDFLTIFGTNWLLSYPAYKQAIKSLPIIKDIT